MGGGRGGGQEKEVGEMSSPSRELSNPNIFKRFYCIMKTVHILNKV